MVTDTFKWGIESLLFFKSPEPDGIYTTMLQWGLHVLLPILGAIVRSYLLHRYVPTGCRKIRIVIIYKPERIDYTELKG